MKDFTVNKIGKYFNVEYLGFNKNNSKLDLYKPNNIFLNTRTEVESFITYIRDIDIIMSEMNNIDSKRIIRYYLNIIDSVSSGLDVRSKWTKKEFAEYLIENYNNTFNKHLEVCNETLDWIKKNECNYYTNWKRFDKYNDYNELFEFGLPKLDKDYEFFTKDPLDELKELADDILDSLIKSKKNK